MSHITAKCILIFSIHRNKSSEGVSLLTQLFYALVFVTRYTDLFRESYAWNYFFKVFYLLSSFYTIGIIRFIYPRTREREVAWKLSAIILAACLFLSPFVMLIFDDWWSFQEYLWVFSQVLESVCVLPQLLLLRQTTIPTVITSFYIVFLGSYRGLYLLNWILKELDTNMKKPNPISVIFGVIQTALYLDFAWVSPAILTATAPTTRRVPPALGRNGFNHHQQQNGGNNNGGGGVRPKWGSRGISISADEGVLEHERERGQALDEDDDEDGGVAGAVDPDAKMRDPDELALALDEDEDLDAPGASSASSAQQKKDTHTQPSGVRGGDEWNDD
ncbi:hypothetical protein CHGG_01416 [Chaetomium globosum CBS 148.51]|uniref:ER lumen protein-retaining receptor n=1 Tax=Chaetomium globosum (strain ATCC 6205 / CBS 148.51 / DSM 1962 / NBRC 6347 / NRRL 1970) TaxID=306901 RepID=Q2HED8_CHAGB|nr:uncharacterized protein CHGG_01416 [Chaetomium globosum CBS 148.51]EAQ93181.1 hypothetical protein CHGG_01416 [Chaetomium globosum CBS 148.51]